jgi:D-glycero-alpha-D-manno-heptose 1-phosphate guanylyltransferase
MDNAVTEAIILAGGLGTRLRSEFGEFPKSLAPVNGRPFIHYLLRYLKKQGIESAVLSVGYKHELIEQALGNNFEGIKIQYVVENEPMGTGGGMKLALEKTTSEYLFVFNGDTYFDVDLKKLQRHHVEKKSNCTIALKELSNVERYGSVEMNDKNKIVAFREKQPLQKALINGGIYCINRGVLIHYPVGTPFSFETNYLEKNTPAKNIHGVVFDNYFMDIGVPEDYHQFEKDMQT